MKLSRHLLVQIHAHLEAGYPDEACGIMLGRAGRITEVTQVGNIRTDNCRQRYRIDPLAYLRVKCAAAEHGRQVLGIYHSHPDRAAQPSQFDLDNAWPDLSYLIVAVLNGRAGAAGCWRRGGAARQFVAETVEILD